MIIILDECEMAICKMMAERRHATAREHNVRDQRMDKKMSGFEIDLLGAVSEMAWAKWRNTYPDLTASPRSGTYDAEYLGVTIDIKATKYKNGRLLSTLKKKEEDAQVYVLAIVEDNKVDFVGWTKASTLLSEENIGDLGCGKGYIMNQDQLTKFKEDGDEDNNV